MAEKIILTNHIQVFQPIHCQYLLYLANELNDPDDPHAGTQEYSIIELTQEHMNNFCMGGCPFFEGGAQGEGIECKYADGTNNPIEMIFSGAELRERSFNYLVEIGEINLDEEPEEIEEPSSIMEVAKAVKQVLRK